MRCVLTAIMLPMARSLLHAGSSAALRPRSRILPRMAASTTATATPAVGGAEGAGGKLGSLRQLMSELNIDAFVVPSDDPHLSEYVAPCYERRSYISGFTGSAGSVVVTQVSWVRVHVPSSGPPPNERGAPPRTSPILNRRRLGDSASASPPDPTRPDPSLSLRTRRCCGRTGATSCRRRTSSGPTGPS